MIVQDVIIVVGLMEIVVHVKHYIKTLVVRYVVIRFHVVMDVQGFIVVV